VGAEEVRGAAAQVHLYHLAVAVEQRPEHGHLPHEAVQVGFAAAEVAGDDAVAAAVEAGAEAERDVRVQRQPARDRVVIAEPRRASEIPRPEFAAGPAGGRVGSAAWPA